MNFTSYRFILVVSVGLSLILSMLFKKVRHFFVVVSLGLECTLNQALIRDKRLPKLSILAASQTKDKTILTEEGVGRVLDELKGLFEYIIW